MLLSACTPLVPATTPPQLQHTPAAFIVVTDTTLDAGMFTVDYPASWRIVKSSIAASDRVQVVFVTADDSTVTLTEVETVADSPSPDEQFITLANDVVVQVIVKPSEQVDEHFDDLTAQLIASIRATD